MTDRFSQLSEPTVDRVLLARADRNPSGVAAAYVSGDGEDRVVSFGELMARANRFATAYRQRAADGRQPMVCVCLYPGVELHAAFLGGILANQMPSMIAPPSPRMEREKYLRSFIGMMDHLRPDLVVSDGIVLEELSKIHSDGISAERLLDSSTLAGPVTDSDPVAGSSFQPDTDPDSVVLLQHSSGTTGLQKGVALSHRSILNQIRSYATAIELAEHDVLASWLPLYHDMGMIACFMLPMLCGIPLVEISPFDWVSQPALLPRKIKQHQATLCWLPNFAYSFMSKAIRPSQMDQADFGTVRVFINCSEPVMADSHEQFAQRFADHGVTPEQLTACYAMAENVFAVTQSPIGQSPRIERISKDVFEREHRAAVIDGGPSIRLVSNGPPIDGVDVRVIDKTGSTLPDRLVGEICIRGDSLFDGYFNNEKLTNEVHIDGWYRTGDLGYLADGELYVTGRMKDLIILQGRNFYPADLEAEVGEVDGLIRGRVVTFGDSDPTTGTESLIVIAETAVEDQAEQGKLKMAIRAQIAQSFDCTVGGVHLVPPRWMIKSTSGKVARADNREKYRRELLTG